MGLWQFVTAQGMDHKDSTAQTRQFLEKVTISDLQNPKTWELLSTIVKIVPNADIFPVRAKYGDEAQYTIGLNYLSSEVPLWFTLADCISSKLLTGKTPDILKALSFTPQNMQDGLKSVNIAGNSDYGVNPCEGDFFKRVIDLRTGIKKQLKAAPSSDKHIYERQQLALKILANSTSYGIFVELNVEEEKTLQSMQCYGAHDNAMSIQKKKFEAAGTFFHPLLATLITSGARLMLSITEKMACDAGLNWAFCDTDSKALAKPESMPEDEFYKRAKKVQEWFTPLNPYTEKEPLLKIEDYNYPKSGGTVLQSLYCYAISSKRYALFNQDSQGNITLRKVSAHGLGHLIAPYQSNDISNLEEVLPWQQDFWLQIIKAELEGHPNQPDFETLHNFNRPAISRYGATTPTLTKWFEAHNQDKPYSKKVRPFNFLLAMQAGKKSLPSSQIRPVSPFNKDHKRALAQCFDRMTGNSIKPSQLKTYIESLSQYHLHPETKFLNGDYTDKGMTQRRHIRVKAIQHIGKEANKWEEQYFTGYDPEAQIEYGICSDQNNKMLESIINTIKIYGTKSMAKVSKLSERYILKVYNNKAKPSNAVIKKLYSAIEILDNLKNEEQELIQKINKNIAEKNISIRNIAREISLDPSNLAKILSGHRKNLGHLEIAHEYLKKFI
jgi:transcriptional regulator with XRE-family HTH domain